MKELKDQRALGLPDIPYSAYCRVCWQNIYVFWIEKEDHGGACPFGATETQNCAQAMAWEASMADLRKLKLELKAKSPS